LIRITDFYVNNAAQTWNDFFLSDLYWFLHFHNLESLDKTVTKKPEDLNDSFGISLAAIVLLGYFVYQLCEGKIYTHSVSGYVITPENDTFFWVSASILVILLSILIYIFIKKKI